MDNTSRALAYQIGQIFIGRHCHRFNLTAKGTLEKKEFVIEKVPTMMKKISFQIISAKFQKLTPLTQKP